MSYKVHHIGFYKPKPKGIYCMALQIEEEILAVSRSNASLELWCIKDNPFIMKIIMPNTKNFSIEGLAWYKNRLFSVGLHGFLIEYDLIKLDIKNYTTFTGGAAFCLDINNKNQIAVGTELGYINIFTINDNDIIFNKFLDKQEGRIFSLKFDNSGEFIVTGGIDAIRIWSVHIGHALHKLTTGRSENNKETIVWSLAITQDLTIISGDSRGRLIFWNGKIGAQISSFQSHRADILSICLCDNEQSLLCSGVDPNIIQFVKIIVKDCNYKWIKGNSKKIHDHDVTSLIYNNCKVYSGGVDGYLGISNQLKNSLKYPPFLQNSVCVGNNLIMLKYYKHVEIWKLGEANVEMKNNFFNLKSNPKKLAILQRKTKDKKEGVVYSTLSEDGKMFLFSTRLGSKLFHINTDNDEIKLIHFKEECCVQAIFSKNSLYMAEKSGGIKIYDVTQEEPYLAQIIDVKGKLFDTIMFMSVSSCGIYLVVADAKSNIGIWKMGKFYYSIPQYKKNITALKINTLSLNLIIVYSDRHLIEYNLEMKEQTEFSKNWLKKSPKQWIMGQFPIKNITFDHRTDNIIILHDDCNIFIINKQIFKDDQTNHEKGNESFFKIIKKYKHLVYLETIMDNQIVAVEVNPLTLLQQVPICKIQNTFGKK